MNESTFHLLNKDNFLLIKKGAYLINTARGPVVDEDILVKFLKNDHLAGAGLDVFENEPQVHPELLKMNNVVLLPHIGSATTETREEMARIAANNVVQYLETGKALTPVF